MMNVQTHSNICCYSVHYIFCSNSGNTVMIIRQNNDSVFNKWHYFLPLILLETVYFLLALQAET